MTRFPNWVYEMYSAQILVETLHNILGTLKLFSHTKLQVPTDPIALSFWIASNFPLPNVEKLKLLTLNNSVQRLRAEIDLLQKVRIPSVSDHSPQSLYHFCLSLQAQILLCKRCGNPVAKQKDIFSMSADGPQSAYVNPQGYVHETLTLYRCRGIQLHGEASTEYSWFPG